MQLVRSFPDVVPAYRAHVRDDARKFYNHDWDYSQLVGFGDDILHLDWDIAVGQEDLVEFADRARKAPDEVLVAPYKVYPDRRQAVPGQRRASLSGPTWTMRRYEGGGLRRVTEDDPSCHLFGFGMVYLPRDLITGFIEANAGVRFDDTAFSGWAYKRTGREVPITWDIRPVHLNYPISETIS